MGVRLHVVTRKPEYGGGDFNNSHYLFLGWLNEVVANADGFYGVDEYANEVEVSVEALEAALAEAKKHDPAEVLIRNEWDEDVATAGELETILTDWLETGDRSGGYIQFHAF